MPLYAKPVGVVQHVLAIAAGKIAFGETTIINSVEQVGFAHAILSANAYDPFSKWKVAGLVVLELGERYVI